MEVERTRHRQWLADSVEEGAISKIPKNVCGLGYLRAKSLFGIEQIVLLDQYDTFRRYAGDKCIQHAQHPKRHRRTNGKNA